MTRNVEAWCCGVAADHELGETNVEVYASEEMCLEKCSCARNDPKRCTPRRLMITFETNWIRAGEEGYPDGGDN